MTDQSADLVTKIDVIPELEGLNSFDAAIERAIAKVNQLDAAIKRVNNLKPASPYAPTNTVSMPSAATTTAVATIAATGANLVNRTPLADTVRKEAQKVARAAVEGTASGITEKISIPASNLYRLPHNNEFGGFLPPPGTGRSGGGFNVPPSGASGWSAGRAGGLLDPQSLRRGPFADMDFSPSRFSGESLEAKKKPVAEGVEKATRSPFGVDNMLAGAGLTAGIIAAGNALADSLDSVQRQQAQIARLAQTTGDAKDAFFALNAAASDVKSDSGAFISTYTNMATATQKLGLSQEETIKATQGLVGALQLGGAETHTINDALYQMGQAFSSDRFGGDEFRSFMEAIGTMAPKVAEAFGTDVKGLRAMSQAGKLTSEIMIKAFQKMAATNPAIMKMLRALSGASDEAANNVNKDGSVSDTAPTQKSTFSELFNFYNLFGNAGDYLKERGNDFNPLNGIESFLNMFLGEDNVNSSAELIGTSKAGAIVNNNSGNRETHIHVDSAKEAAETVNNLDNPGAIYNGLSGNIAESTGAL
ncbi:tape measure protein [Salmonella enterica subsp. enterica serovar Luciana]|nr:tape measure protein [Salmonella enterica subsp. enterica serovar Luciana]